jgi:hypothetical protein
MRFAAAWRRREKKPENFDKAFPDSGVFLCHE